MRSHPGVWPVAEFRPEDSVQEAERRHPERGTDGRRPHRQNGIVHRAIRQRPGRKRVQGVGNADLLPGNRLDDERGCLHPFSAAGQFHPPVRRPGGRGVPETLPHAGIQPRGRVHAGHRRLGGDRHADAEFRVEVRHVDGHRPVRLEHHTTRPSWPRRVRENRS